MALDGLSAKLSKQFRITDGFLNAKTFGNISIGTKGVLLQKSIPSLQLSEAVVARLDREDPKCIHNLFYFLFGLADTTTVPQCCQEVVVLQRTLRKRAGDLGRPSQAWLDTIWKKVVGDGESVLDWGQCGAFQFNLPVNVLQDKQPQVKHISGLTAPIPEGLAITKDTEIFDNCMDTRACIMIGNRPLALREWFQRGQGPNEATLVNAKNKCLSSDGEKFQKQVAAEAARTSAATVADSSQFAASLEDNRKARAKEQAAKRPPVVGPAKRRRSGASCVASSAAAGDVGEQTVAKNAGGQGEDK